MSDESLPCWTAASPQWTVDDILAAHQKGKEIADRMLASDLVFKGQLLYLIRSSGESMEVWAGRFGLPAEKLFFILRSNERLEACFWERAMGVLAEMYPNEFATSSHNKKKCHV